MKQLHCYFLLPLFLLCLFFNTITIAQETTAYFGSDCMQQYGYSVKAQIEFGTTKTNYLNWRVGVSGGIGRTFLGVNFLYPSLNADLLLLHGGIGSKWPGVKTFNYYLDAEFILGYTLTAGFVDRFQENSGISPKVVDYPLYYFNTFNKPALQNPYNWSVSLGGNVVVFLTPKLNKAQFVGFMNLHADRAQISYYNDGGVGFDKLPFLADDFDRWHTGGGFLSLHGNNNWAVNLVEFGFDKFTGYTSDTYELSVQLRIDYLYYKDATQQALNKSHYYLNVGNTEKNWGANFNMYNKPQWDAQYAIHQLMYLPIHLVSYDEYFSCGGTYFYNNTKIGLK